MTAVGLQVLIREDPSPDLNEQHSNLREVPSLLVMIPLPLYSPERIMNVADVWRLRFSGPLLPRLFLVGI